MKKIENETVQLALSQISEDITKIGKFKNDLQLIEYIKNYILDIEEQNRMMRISNENFKMMLAEYDSELKAQLERVK